MQPVGLGPQIQGATPIEETPSSSSTVTHSPYIEALRKEGLIVLSYDQVIMHEKDAKTIVEYVDYRETPQFPISLHTALQKLHSITRLFPSLFGVSAIIAYLKGDTSKKEAAYHAASAIKLQQFVNYLYAHRHSDEKIIQALRKYLDDPLAFAKALRAYIDHTILNIPSFDHSQEQKRLLALLQRLEDYNEDRLLEQQDSVYKKARTLAFPVLGAMATVGALLCAPRKVANNPPVVLAATSAGVGIGSLVSILLEKHYYTPHAELNFDAARLSIKRAKNRLEFQLWQQEPTQTRT